MTEQELAAAIVQELFVNGSGEFADRLVLTVDGPPRRDLGGWSRRGAIDQIQKVLSRKEGTEHGAKT